ncbi:MAG TPA: OadG family protein [bacterium]|nr:OadG family protein [bacterium]HPS29669.1 OadG family protein [bacterium]HQJ60364.1 OadG family protein [bacterium]
MFKFIPMDSIATGALQETNPWILLIIGMGVVISSLALLAILIKFFAIVMGKKEQNKAQISVSAATPVTSVPTEDDEAVAIASALYLYASEQSAVPALTDRVQVYNINPWNNAAKAEQCLRFQKWQSIKK